MIRYYERVGLVPAATRTKGNYREYSDRDVNMLRFIRGARDLGFSVDEIRALLSLWSDKSRHSADVKELARSHVSALRTRILGLEQMVRTLERLVESCHGDDRPDCPILEGLENTEEAEENLSLARPARFGAKG